MRKITYIVCRMACKSMIKWCSLMIWLNEKISHHPEKNEDITEGFKEYKKNFEKLLEKEA